MELELLFMEAVEMACLNHNYKKWFEDDFDTDLYYGNEEELLQFEEDDLTTVMSDWVHSKTEETTAEVCKMLGIICMDNSTLLHSRLLEKLCEMVQEKLMEELRELWLTERAYIHISSEVRKALECMLNMTGKEINSNTGFFTDGQPLTWTAYFDDGLEADIKFVFGGEDETPCMIGVLICNEQAVFTNDYSDYFGTWEFEYMNKTYLVNFDDTKETFFNEIIEKCYDMSADDCCSFENFGMAGDLTLLFSKDSNYNPEVDEDESNMVFIVTERNLHCVDDSGNIHVSDLWRELERIWYEKELSTM